MLLGEQQLESESADFTANNIGDHRARKEELCQGRKHRDQATVELTRMYIIRHIPQPDNPFHVLLQGEANG